ncbi:MAG: hypothetical protein KDK04_09630 [Candidatus Competibacteraceae bacterium]|nr:hypothetical protein [Candidatus Competibacteraceae bacterium]
MENVLNKFNSEFMENGSFMLLPDESIKTVVNRENVAPGYGVYVISACKGDVKKIIYFGKSGTIKNDGTFKRQGLKRRLTMK